MPVVVTIAAAAALVALAAKVGQPGERRIPNRDTPDSPLRGGVDGFFGG